MSPFVASARWLLGYQGVPLMARPTIRYELISTLFTGLADGVIVAQLTTAFVMKTLGAPQWIAGLLVCELSLGNFITSFVGSYLERLRRVRMVVACQTIMAVAMFAIALLPARQVSVWPYILLLLVPALLGGIGLTLQTSVRHSNFPASMRGRLFSRLFIVRAATSLAAVTVAAAVLDRWHGGHHLLYPLAGLCLLGSAAAYRRIRVRRERALIRAYRLGRLNLLGGFAVLLKDPPFGRYMTWQMVSGAANLMLSAVTTVVFVKRLHADYQQISLVQVLVPTGLALMCAPLAGRMFDSMPITHYRMVNMVLLTVGAVLIYLSLLLSSWTWLIAGFAVQGVASASGGVVWNMGHTRFAPPGQSQEYMGIHLTLQGIRGVSMPLVGIWLYNLPWMDIHLYLVGAAAFAASCIGYWRSGGPTNEVVPNPFPWRRRRV